MTLPRISRHQIADVLRRPFTWYVLSLLSLMGVALVCALLVFWRGLVITNLTDLVPWGLWISVDLSAIALSAGAFSVSAIAYLLRRKELLPVAKTAVYLGFIGYSIAMMMLLMDIGRPDRFWHGFVFWNIHSPLWEVTMCVGLYFTVLLLEVIPIVAHWKPFETRFPKLAHRMARVHNVAPVLAVIGLCLSTLHQSSLGLTYGKLVARPIWHGELSMAVLFYVSAIVGGMALVAFTTLLAGQISPRARVNYAVMEKLARVVGWGAVVLLVLRWVGLMATPAEYEAGISEALYILTRGRLAFNFWGLEIILGLVIPIIILLTPSLRRTLRYQMLALAFVAVGVVALRWDTNLVGQLIVFGNMPTSDIPRFTTYTPSLIEVLVAVGVLAYGLLAVTLGVRYLNVIDHGPVAEVPTEVTIPAAMIPSSSR